MKSSSPVFRKRSRFSLATLIDDSEGIKAADSSLKLSVLKKIEIELQD